MPRSFIREYFEEALRLEATMLVNLLVKEVVLYNDRIQIHFNSPIKNCPDESQGFSFYKGFISTQCAQTMELEMCGVTHIQQANGEKSIRKAKSLSVVGTNALKDKLFYAICFLLRFCNWQ